MVRGDALGLAPTQGVVLLVLVAAAPVCVHTAPLGEV